jgi:Uma2 family endonuclease
MATATIPPPTEAARELDVQPFDVTSEMFFQMIEAGVFPPERRVFLWGGRLYERMAKTPAHATTFVRVQDRLRIALPADWLIWPENPIAIDRLDAPLPDVTVVRGPLARYEDANRHPQVDEVGLIVEIAVSSLTRDLTLRAKKFAQALVPNYWVADVLGRRIIEHSALQVVDGVGRYSQVQERKRGDVIRLVLDGQEIAAIPVAELIR